MSPTILNPAWLIIAMWEWVLLGLEDIIVMETDNYQIPEGHSGHAIFNMWMNLLIKCYAEVYNRNSSDMLLLFDFVWTDVRSGESTQGVWIWIAKVLKSWTATFDCAVGTLKTHSLWTPNVKNLFGMLSQHCLMFQTSHHQSHENDGMLSDIVQIQSPTFLPKAANRRRSKTFLRSTGTAMKFWLWKSPFLLLR